jgi:hypothetical protein
MGTRGTLVFASVVVMAGCATGLPRCPEKGGPAWRVVESEHFVVLTDATSAKAAETAADLEYVRKALVQFLLPGGTGPAGRTPVFLLDGAGHFDAYFPGDLRGIYTELFFVPTIAMARRDAALSTATLIEHELTHYIVDRVISADRLPRWVAEGLASYTETITTRTFDVDEMVKTEGAF